MIKRRGDVLKISFSAFFADLGYQAVVASFPIVFVLVFNAPIPLYGFAEALNYGLGTFMSYIGGIAGDKYGRKKIAIIGNILIILVSFVGFAKDYVEALIFFMLGWWFRNFRSPPRRAMMAEVTTQEERAEAFGILHSLDIAGALLAITYLSTLLFFHFPILLILPFTAIPLVISTIVLGTVNAGERVVKEGRKEAITNKKVFWTIIVSTMFFGFSQYSFGFPILTTAEISGKDYLGIISYGVFLGASSLFGYVFGKLRLKELSSLAFLGYLVASLASLGFALLSKFGLITLYPLSFIMGIAVASTETFEPTIISKLIKEESYGAGMGYLSAGRSIGLFLGNTVMGFLYQISYSYAYLFASTMSLVSFLLVLSIILRK
ncbi:MFS transporter [Sulfolobus sp. A20]|uniref:MFS transporter n=1 Tax=Saccharolobus sp. A20 TaxID=1891280 RepID=UPI000845D07A|nr:MFS transporter [Sulfolobus sp. A20]TRM76301.1 MFS transporter [Sulfolobus sp. E5]TRM84024.1 MFS transporter [Sulfolobus sp. A20-N-F6]TRM84990.1 MFS transporter [Sulfolobus sp. F3]TRM88585.1 MFS transporter [Sulfolobus sp. E3]TRM98739.1 MFS transporter [Sulfolobus sp. E1]TRN02670.1 MFS transporter [Sulfolobus sp. F1]